MIKLARILRINNSNITLKLEHNKQCSNCQSHCNDGFLGFLFNKYQQGELKVSRNNKKHDNQLLDETGFFNDSYQVDDVVGIDFEDKNVLRLTSLLYGLPIVLIVLMLSIGFFISSKLGLNTDIGGIIGFFAGLLLSKLLIKKNQSKIIPKVKFFK